MVLEGIREYLSELGCAAQVVHDISVERHLVLLVERPRVAMLLRGSLLIVAHFVDSAGRSDLAVGAFYTNPALAANSVKFRQRIGDAWEVDLNHPESLERLARRLEFLREPPKLVEGS